MDELRGIYPRLKACSAQGIESVGDDEIAALYRDIIAARRRPTAAE